MYFVYILLCDGRKYYVGFTNNLVKRFSQHKNKESRYTKQFDKVDLVYHEHFRLRKDAEKREKQLKGWSVAKKKALINGNIEQLVKLSKS